MKLFNLFLTFPDKASIENAIWNEVAFDAYLLEIKDLIDRADCEQGVNLFYDSNETNAFAQTLDTHSDLIQDYLIDDPYILINALLRNSTDWTEHPLQDSACFYGLWDFDSRYIEQNIPLSMKEASEYSNKNQTLLINVKSGFHAHENCLFILKDSSTYATKCCPIFFKIDQVHSLNGLENWFQIHRPNRKINTTDQRHNEESPFYIKGKSPLLFDLTRNGLAVKHVQDLLNSAIGDTHESKDLMNYDHQKERYIWFENENANNQYHAYHLALPRTHESDEKAISNIPKRAKQFIDMKKED